MADLRIPAPEDVGAGNWDADRSEVLIDGGNK